MFNFYVNYSRDSKFVYTRSALSLLEKISRCIECNEPVLVCGETGVGKTTALQHLARLLGKTISIINLNHQTETSDLLGSFKPVDTKYQMKVIKEKFLALFMSSFNVDENQKFLQHVTVIPTIPYNSVSNLYYHFKIGFKFYRIVFRPAVGSIL